jgi:predicted AlkP superfamily pyrophosphatase or phosphodiesterase
VKVYAANVPAWGVSLSYISVPCPSYTHAVLQMKPHESSSGGLYMHLRGHLQLRYDGQSHQLKVVALVRTEAGEFILKSYKPNLMLIHLADLDSTHHLTGPRTPAAIAMAEKQDGYIKRLVDATREGGFFDNTTFFIVSDHGFAAINRQFEPNVALVQAKLITLDAQGKPVSKPVSWKAAAWPAGGSCGIVLHDQGDKKTARQVTELFSTIARQQDAPISDVLRTDDLARLEAMPQAALMLDGAAGYTFGGAFTGPEIHDTAFTYRGTHGYLPTKPEMRASLIIFGEKARAGSHIPLARMIDIGPTAAEVLGLSIPREEGHPISALIKP